MYLNDDGFVISGSEIMIIGFVIFVVYIIIISSKSRKETYKPKSKEIKEIEIEEIKEDEIVEFKEKIANVPFAYNEKTKTLKIGEEGVDEIEMELKDGIIELRKYVDRLEKYVEESK